MIESLTLDQQQALIALAIKSINEYHDPPDASYQDISLGELIGYNLQDWIKDFETERDIDWESQIKETDINPESLFQKFQNGSRHGII